MARNAKRVHVRSSTDKSNEWFRFVWRMRRRRVRESVRLRRSLRTTSRGDEDCVPVVSFYGTTASGVVIRCDPGVRKALLDCPRQTAAINWHSRLLLVIMQQPSRTQKRGVPPEKMPSTAALEVTAVVQEDGPPKKKKQKKGKKRATEKTGIDHVLPAPGPQAGPSQPSGNRPEFEESTQGSISDPELVGTFHVCHVIDPHRFTALPSSRDGSHVKSKSYMNSSLMKPLGIHRALRATHLQSTVVAAAFLMIWCASVAYFQTTRTSLSTTFRYRPSIYH